MQATSRTPARNLQRLMVVLTGVCLVCTGCATTRTVALDPPPAVAGSDFESGRRVTVVLQDGTKIRGRIVAARENGLTIDPGSNSARIEVAFRDMQSLQVRDPSTGRTVAAVIGGVLVVAAGVLYYLLLQYHKNDD